jgi:membrane-associated phospholipid phosphatase
VHKVRATGAIRLASMLLLWPAFAETQTPELGFRARDGLWLAIGTALYATPHIFSINHGPAPCSPCDAAAVPWFDRWTISEPRLGWDAASTVTVGILGTLTVADLLIHHRKVEPPGPGVKLVQSAALALGTVELSKALAARNRPVLYTDQAPQYRHRLDSRRSWPSGHSAAAAALATSYLLSSGGAEPVRHGWQSWAAGSAAAAVGIMRVAAGRHFPSDVLGGFAVGVLSAIAVHRIEF